MTLLIHPGFHKTGTTFLQECVFSDERIFGSLMSHQEVHDHLVGPHDLQFDPEPVRLILADRMSQLSAQAAGVLSSEILCGTMFSGAKDSVSIAQRLHAIAPSARVLFTVRRQDELLRSVYLQYVKRGGRKTLQDFLEYRTEPGFHWFNLSILEFDRLVQYYASAFGDDRVLVLPQELMKESRTHFLELLFHFAQVEGDPASRSYSGTRGKSPPVSGIPLMRFANGFRQTPLNPEAFSGLSKVANKLISLAYRYEPGKVDVDQAMVAQIRDVTEGRFAVSNKLLQRFVPVPLEGYGYEVAN